MCKEIKKETMNFESLSRLNVVINVLSGNLLPVRHDKTKTSIVLKIYLCFAWLIGLLYLFTCFLGVFHVSKEKALQDSTVNFVVSLEVILLSVHLHSHKNLLRGLIEKLNSVLTMDNETLRNTVIKTVKPLDKPLRIYAIAAVSSVVIWASLPLVKIFQRKQFRCEDYSMPAILSKEPFSASILVAGVLLQMVGGGYTIFKKISLDIYTMHLILLMTAQYRYLRIKLAEILGNDGATIHHECSRNINSDCMVCESIRGSERLIKEKMNLLLRHHSTVVQISVMLRKLLAPNITLLYLNNVFRFCFLGLMFIMTPSICFEKFVVAMYSVGAFAQLFVLCFCIQQLFEASGKVTDDGFHEKWYTHSAPLRHTFSTMILANKLECRISGLRNIDLTLPSYMSILNHAYSVCLLFVRMQ